MRKTAESRYDVAVLDRIAQRFGIADRGEQIDTLRLHVEVLAVHERHIDKLALGLRERAIVTALDCELRERERALIASERLRRAAMEVSGELIEHDDRRQITLRRIAHCNRFGPECLVQCTEAIANSSVELLVFLEPVARLELVEPEPENVIDPHAAHRHDKQRWG